MNSVGVGQALRIKRAVDGVVILELAIGRFNSNNSWSMRFLCTNIVESELDCLRWN